MFLLLRALACKTSFVALQSRNPGIMGEHWFHKFSSEFKTLKMGFKQLANPCNTAEAFRVISMQQC